MAFSWFLPHMSLVLILYTDRCAEAVRQCSAPEWFGLPCRYKCHCVNNQCDNNGECTANSQCVKGWFGPACQYVDLVATNTIPSTPGWVYDSPDILCNTGLDTLTVSLNGTFYFTWLRLRANATVSPQDFTLHLMDAYGTTVKCSNMYTSLISDTLLDIHCQQGAFFQNLSITGAGVKRLCSVMVSGGRNVALGQNTTETSVIEKDLVASLAVDGNRNSTWVGRSCYHTDNNDKRPTWTLYFERSYHVNRYSLYNRNILQERLSGFILVAYQEYSRVAFTYTDHTNTNHDIYSIPSTTPLIPVSSVSIISTYKEPESRIFLTLCEVEMFGDTVCPAGYYGRDCEKRCNCAKSGDSCFVSTGGCPSGCAAGFHWEECKKSCSKKYFGVNCLQKCSTNCTDELCEATNGTCLSCIPGNNGALCDQACSKKYFGVSCLQKCSTNCTDELCEATCGTCLSCIPGKQGPFCDQALPVQGHEECISVAVVVGLVIAFVGENILIVIGVLIWRKLKHKMDETRQTTPHIYHKYSKADGVRTLELNTVTTTPDKSVTGQEHSPDHPYEIPSNSTAQTQKTGELKSEDHVTYAHDTVATPNDTFDDTMANTYMDINDV